MVSAIIELEREAAFIGRCLEGFFYGIYSGIFILYIQHQASTKGSRKTKNIVFYALCALYVLSVVTIVVDTRLNFFLYETTSSKVLYSLVLVQKTASGSCDFIAQSILIYRCWIVWGYNTRVVIFSSFLAITFLVTWVVIFGSLFIVGDGAYGPSWAHFMVITSVVSSGVVNALVTGLIVFRISKVSRKAKPSSDSQYLGVTSSGGNKFRSVIFVLIESGMVLFSAQLVWIVFFILQTEIAYIGFNIVVGVQEMVNCLTPTVILVRVAMGLSFHDEESMIQSVGSLNFASDNPNQNPETGTISVEHQESRDEPDDIVIQNDDSDIEIVHR